MFVAEISNICTHDQACKCCFSHMNAYVVHNNYYKYELQTPIYCCEYENFCSDMYLAVRARARPRWVGGCGGDDVAFHRYVHSKLKSTMYGSGDYLQSTLTVTHLYVLTYIMCFVVLHKFSHSCTCSLVHIP